MAAERKTSVRIPIDPSRPYTSLISLNGSFEPGMGQQLKKPSSSTSMDVNASASSSDPGSPASIQLDNANANGNTRKFKKAKTI